MAPTRCAPVVALRRAAQAASDQPAHPVTVAPGREAALDNNANKVSPPSDVGKRQARYARRALLWNETRSPRLCSCGRARHAEVVSVRLTDGTAGFAGVKTCGNVWICPVCNAKIMARRSLEIGTALGFAQLLGLRTAFLTFTMRHHEGQRLSELWDAIALAWKYIVSGAPWVRTKAKHGIVGFIRVTEVTWGGNGWHVHLHVILLFESKSVDIESLHAWMFARWQKKIVSLGYEAPLMAGQDAQLIGVNERVADYLTKSTDRGKVIRRAAPKLAQELTNTQAKRARTVFSTRSTWELLDDWFGLGDAAAENRWHEFEASSKGRRQIGWSRGLRELLGMAIEKTDEEIAAEEIGTRQDDLVRITPAGWSQAVRTPDLLPAILTTTERAGFAGLRALLDEHCIEYTIPED